MGSNLHGGSELTCLQANLGRSRTATQELPIDPIQVDVFLLQEPYQREGTIPGLPLTWKVAHVSNGQTAIIVTNPKLTLQTLYGSKNITAVNVQDAARCITFVSTYFPLSERIEQKLDELEKVLDKIHNPLTVIGGDFNAHNALWGPAQGSHHDQRRGTSVLDFILRRDLYLWNDPTSKPTFETINGKSWIDLTLSSQQLQTHCGTWDVVDSTFSDHNYISFSIGRVTTCGLPRRYSFDQYRLRRLASRLRPRLNDMIPKIDAAGSPAALDEAVEQITAAIKAACDKSLRIKSNGQPRKPWWDQELTVQRKKTRALRKRYQKTSDPNERLSWRSQYKKAAAVYRRTLLDKKRASWFKYCDQESKANPWSLPYKLAAGKHSKPPILGSVIKRDGTATLNESETIDEIVKATFPQDDRSSESNDQRSMRAAAETYACATQDLLFTKTEIRLVIKRLAKRKAPGLDGINLEIIEVINNFIPLLLYNLYNKCLVMGHFPQSWKIARLVLFNKPGKPKDMPKSYRPICLLDSMSKILDKLVTQRLECHFVNQELLHPRQFGFRSKQSCDTALYNMITEVQELSSKRNRKCVSIISLDVSGAFDTVWWTAVLYLLARAECPINLYRVVESYLSDRSIAYHSSTTVKTYKVTRGCPQGSCSGPFLWNLIADEALGTKLPQGATIQAYADDLTLVISGDSKRELEVTADLAIRAIMQWATKYKLTFNPSKMTAMPVTLWKRLDPLDPPEFYFGTNRIAHVDKFTYLGVLWDSSLTFNPHFKKVTERVNKLAYNLKQTARALYRCRPHLLKRVYTGAIERIALYGYGAWGFKLRSKCFRANLVKIQRSPLLGLTGAYRTTSTVALQVFGGILPLDLRAHKEYAQFLISKVKTDKRIVVNHKLVRFDQYSHDLDDSGTHPASRWGIPFDSKLPNGTGLEVYTDGSGMDGRYGSGVVIQLFGATIDEVGGRLPDTSSVFEAEMTALLHAIRWISRSTDKRADVYSDSLSSLKLLSNPIIRNPLVDSIKSLYLQVIRSCDLRLHWIPAHVGWDGNEAADALAKAQTARDTINWYALPSLSNLKRELNSQVMEEWQLRWDNEVRGAPARLFFPRVRPNRLVTGLFAQLASGHGRFPQYFHRFGYAVDENCLCGQVGTSTHYLLDCEFTADIRNKFATVRGDPSTLFHPVNDNLMREIAKLVAEMLPHFPERRRNPY